MNSIGWTDAELRESAEKSKEVNNAYKRGYDKAKEEYERPQGEWIPVSERLPDKSGRYLITIREGIWTYKKEKIDVFDFDINNCEEMIRSVIAWQTLPEPYQKGGAE